MTGVSVNRRGKGGSGCTRATQATVDLTLNLNIIIHGLAPPQALLISHRGERETRVISDEAQGTMERRCER